MRASAKAPLVLAGVAAALAAYILLVERHGASTDEARDARPHLLGDLRRADVTEIEIDRPGQGRVVLARAGAASLAGEWRLLPGGTPAASAAVADLLDALEGDGLDIDRETGAAPAVTGLAAPVARLVINTTARRWTVAFGHADASGRGVFVNVAGDPRTLVVRRRLLDLIGGGAAAFRERRLFAAGVIESATALAFESRAVPPRTLRRRAGLWLNNEGFFASRAAIGEVWATLAALQASDFPTAAARPAAPADRILVLSSPAGPVRLEVWQPTPPVGSGPGLNASCGAGHGDASTPPLALAVLTLARKSDPEASDPAEVLVCLPETVVGRLWHSLVAADRRDPHLLVVEPTASDGVILVEGDRKLHLRRDPAAGWRIIQPSVGYAVDQTVVEEWLTRLAAALIVDRAPSGAAAGPGTGAAPGGGRRLVVEGAVPAEINVVKLTRGPGVRVDRAGETGPAIADATLFAELDPEPLRFRSRTVLSLPRFDVTGVAISASRGSPTRVQRGPGDQWVIAGEDATTDRTTDRTIDQTTDRLLAIVADLRAQRFLLPTATAPFRAERTFDFTLREGVTPRHQRLELAPSCLARVADTPVFEVDAATCADLRGPIAASR